MDSIFVHGNLPSAGHKLIKEENTHALFYSPQNRACEQRKTLQLPKSTILNKTLDQTLSLNLPYTTFLQLLHRTPINKNNFIFLTNKKHRTCNNIKKPNPKKETKKKKKSLPVLKTKARGYISKSDDVIKGVIHRVKSFEQR